MEPAGESSANKRPSRMNPTLKAENVQVILKG